jgi:uncharacterized membrane protein HdeD (DUF308 family)
MTQVGLRVLSGKSAWWTLLHILFGITTIIIARYDSHDVSLTVGFLCLMMGASLLVHAGQSKTEGHTPWKIVAAAIYVFVGFYLASHLHTRVALALVLTVFFTVQGVAGLATFFRGHKTPGAGWIFLDAIAALVLGVLASRQWQSGSIRVVGVLVGISMITTGVTRTMLTVADKRAAQRAAA